MPIAIRKVDDDTVSNESISRAASPILHKASDGTPVHQVNTQTMKPSTSSFDYHDEKSFIDENFKKQILNSDLLGSINVNDHETEEGSQSESFKTALFSVEEEIAEEINSNFLSSADNRRLSSNAKMSIPDTIMVTSLHPGNVSTHVDQKTPSNEDVATKKSRAGSYKMGYESSSLSEFNDVTHFQLVDIFSKIKKCQDLRKNYQFQSVQINSQNPKNRDDWEIYPEPPKPSYDATTKSEIKVDSRPDWEIFNKDDITIPEYKDEDNEFDYTLNADGTFVVFSKSDEKLINDNIPTLREYYIDLEYIANLSSDGPMKSFAFKRLQFLEARWAMYSLLNEFNEIQQSKTNPHRDFYNCRKVDTHVHHTACMNQKHLLRFIKHKLRHHGDEDVIFRDEKVLSLKEVFQSLKLTSYDLSIDTLDMHAHKDTFHRFDKFNLKYNPVGESRLREIFLKTDNFINGRYLAELTKEVMHDLQISKYQNMEYRVSIYGRNLQEWEKLASWIINNKLFSNNIRWLVQVPRLYDVYKKSGLVNSFQDILNNIFIPLFEVTKNPKISPNLHIFLQRVIGFDSVDDESKIDRRLMKKFPPPSNWSFSYNPPYSYYLYYLYSNMSFLNHWRLKKNLNTFNLRPHCGEAGDPEHLISAYLLSHSISHGILLRKIPFVQYLFYLDQIGIAMSPLSNNALFLTYDKNPFQSFFKKGLNVSLSTDDPLQFSYTKEPLIEEYSVAAQIYKLSNVDMCELAKNSVLQSGFEDKIKKHWIGKNFLKPGVEGNDVEKCNVPDIRVNYRYDTLKTELELVNYFANK
ncbi:hypothetical protein QEN19_000907 [Hanseniaspora menglaensis]